MGKSKKGFSKGFAFILIAFLISMVLVSLSGKTAKNTNVEEISYSEARQKIVDSQIDSVELSRELLTVKLYSDESDVVYKAKIPDSETFSRFMEMSDSDIEFKITDSDNAKILSGILNLLPIVFIIVIVIILMKNIKSVFKDSTINFSQILTGEDDIVSSSNVEDVSFNDVAGIDNERAEVEEVVSMINNPEKYNEMGAKIPKGILLVGEPGTGKTLIARAIAGEAGVNFYNCAGSNFDNVYVGLGASKIRKLFDEARKNAPSIIFIDEFDAVAKRRYNTDSSNEQTLNQLLNEIDGFDESANVIVIAATNHLEVLDPAITRPGRFDRIINIPLPDKKGRREILEVHARDKKFDHDKKSDLLDELAKKTSRMTGAELENILNESAIIAVRNEKESIGKDEIDEAFIKVILGISNKDKEVSEDEKMLVAIHEAGHTIASRVSRPDVEILQVSIIPRGTAGGYNLFNDDENNLPTKEELQKQIIVSLGGRAAEDFYFKTISTGASSDLQNATKIAHQMVYVYAMGTEAQMVRIYGEHDYNNKLEENMFPSMEEIVKESYEKSSKIIKKNSDLLKVLAKMLVEKSTLDSSELEDLFSQYNI